MTTELHAAADRYRNTHHAQCPDQWGDCKAAWTLAAWAVEHLPMDDDETLVTVECMDSLGFNSDSGSPYQRRYEIVPSIRVVAEACEGGFDKCQLWIGGGTSFTSIEKLTRGQLRALCRGLGLSIEQKGTDNEPH